MKPSRPVRTFAAPLLLAGLVAGLVGLPSGAPCAAEDRMPGEASELTEEVRAKAQKLIDAIQQAKDVDEAAKARRALIVLGPAIWPVVDNASHLVPPESAKPHFSLLKALLLKKSEPEFEYFRVRLRILFLTNRVDAIYGEMTAFRVGRPDPARPSSKIAPTCKSTLSGTTAVFRSSDGTIVLAYGPDATDKAPDAVDVAVTENAAGFVGAVGGKPKQAPRTSGRGGAVTVTAPMGFAFAWGINGADGVRPGGVGGEGGAAEAKGGAGNHMHNGAGGNGAPDK